MNSRQIYAYLAGAEGRKIGGTEPSDLYPIVHEGVTYAKIREKGEVVALAFHKKLSAINEHGDERDSTAYWGELPLPPFRESIETDHSTVLRVEIEKAISFMSLKKSPGPDLLPAALYRNIEIMKVYTAAIVDYIIRSGKIPKTLKRI